jgi:F0F1-type ATP synthase assembly protein I
MQFALMIVICLAIGLWVDNRYLIAPWGTLVGGIVGIVGGFYHFLKTVTRHTRNNK